MRLTFYLCVSFCFSQYIMLGQSNTFPSSGNVGIGTAGPHAKLTLGSYTGTMTSATGIALGGDQNVIEFLNSSYELGYGVKLYGLDEGSGLTSFRLAVRGNSTAWQDAIFVNAGDNGSSRGNVGIGTTSPDAKLAVKGTIHTQEVKVDLSGSVAPDYVFEKDYPLTSLSELKSYIDQNKHLPEIPSAKEMEQEGINLKEMNLLLLKKVEELTLHLIQKEQEMKSITAELRQLKEMVYEK